MFVNRSTCQLRVVTPTCFSECAETEMSDLKNCFNFTLQQFVYENFKTPEIVYSEKALGRVSSNVLFYRENPSCIELELNC